MEAVPFVPKFYFRVNIIIFYKLGKSIGLLVWVRDVLLSF